MDKSNVRRLSELFNSGCHYSKISNHIPALIEENILIAASRAASVPFAALKSDPLNDGYYPRIRLPSSYRVTCLHSRHRVLAAKGVLPADDRCWTVDFFDNNLSNNLKLDLIYEYKAEKRPDCGEFYYNIRRFMGYQEPPNLFFEKRWRALLGATLANGPRNLARILNHPDYRYAFDVQLDIPGLSSGIRLSTVHKTCTTCVTSEKRGLQKSFRGIAERYEG